MSDKEKDPKKPKWGRPDPDYVPPSTLDKMGDAIEDVAEDVAEKIKNTAKVTGQTAVKAATGFERLLTGVANGALLVAAGLISIPRYVVNNPKPSAVVGYMHLADPETHLANRDPNYKDKCFTFQADSNIKSSEGQKQTALMMAMLREFNNKGKVTAEQLESSKTIFCFSMNDTSTPEYWSGTKVYVSPARYPEALTALFYAKANFESFWNKAYTNPAEINQFSVESGLIFSRATRGVQAIEEIRNFYRAIDFSSSRHNNLISAPWEEFLKENPNLQKTAAVFLKSIVENGNEDVAMQDALKTFIMDPRAVNDGDVAYLEKYVDHVRLLPQSHSAYIYGERGLGFFAISPDYAFVDIDRDGEKDDLIRLNYSNQMSSYSLDISKSGFYRKEEDYDCSYTDSEGRYIPDTCQRDRYERVQYEQIPARDTASMTLVPETLVQLADKTESNFLSTQESERLINQVTTHSNDVLLYAQPYSPEAAKLMARIREEANKNIPGRVATPSAAGFGLQ